MTTFAIQIDVTDGSSYHFFASGDAAYRQALAIRDGWRTQPSNNFYTFSDGTPQPVNIVVGNIRDVRVVVGDAR